MSTKNIKHPSQMGQGNHEYKHGDSTRKGVTTEYRAWITMKRRCYEPNFVSYPNYGGRGIKVCPQWLNKENGYITFLKDVGRKPSKEYTLDRIKVNKNYTPENVRWSTRTVQARNKTDTIYLTYKGITKCLPDWADEYGMKIATLYNRLYSLKKPLQEALETSVGIGNFEHRNSKKTHCPKGHPYCGDNLLMDSGNRKCRICVNKRNRIRWNLNNKIKKL